MQKKRPWLSLLTAAVAGGAATLVSAAGFGPSNSAAVYGQPLDFTAQLRLDPGETLAPECLSADVTVGERRISPALVRTSFEMQGGDLARVRVRTGQVIDEPVVGVQLQAGCDARVSRRYVLLADPPPQPAATTTSMAMPMAMPMMMATALTVAPAYAAAPPALPSAPNASAASDVSMPFAMTATGATAPAAAATLRRVVATETPRSPRPRAQSRSERRAAAANATRSRADAPRRNRVRTATVAAPAAPGPRLRLDTAEPPRSEEAVAVELALEAVAQAASAAREAASAASTAQGRIAALERTVDGLRNDAQGQRDLSLQLRQRLARSEDASRWLWPLVAAVLALAGLVWWLARRLAGLRREHQTSWRTVATATAAPPTPADDHQPAAPMPFVTAAARAPAAKQPLAPAWPPPAPVESWDDLALQATQPIAARAGSQDNSALDTAMQRTEVLAPGARSATDDDAASPRDVSIEELIDLEQQAEFFVVLGQDDAAIELLAEHLRHTGGGSPLPYLKLLEIYRRRGDHDDYENIRARFNHRFNAYAPEWGSDLGAGRTLEDYPGILPRLEQAWVRPLDAMAEMEALLFRKSRGDLFELPAYRELLFLYSMARDLLDREVADSGSVDLLLPLVSSELGGEFGSTAPAPYLSLDAERGKQRTGNAKGDRPTPPALDFDLSAEGQRQTSIFDPLDQHGGPAKRR